MLLQSVLLCHVKHFAQRERERTVWKRNIQSPRKLMYLCYSNVHKFYRIYMVLTLFTSCVFLQRATCTSQLSFRTTQLLRRTRWFCPASWARPLARSDGSKTVTKYFPPRTFSSDQTARSAFWSSRRQQRATWARTPATVAPTKPQHTWTSKVIPAVIWTSPPLPRPWSGLQKQAFPSAVHQNPTSVCATGHQPLHPSSCVLFSHLNVFGDLSQLEDNPTLHIIITVYVNFNMMSEEAKRQNYSSHVNVSCLRWSYYGSYTCYNIPLCIYTFF